MIGIELSAADKVATRDILSGYASWPAVESETAPWVKLSTAVDASVGALKKNVLQ
jgi:hypothetical protein